MPHSTAASLPPSRGPARGRARRCGRCARRRSALRPTSLAQRGGASRWNRSCSSSAHGAAASGR
eukprot:2813569-Prymnesium_polylepis.1